MGFKRQVFDRLLLLQPLPMSGHHSRVGRGKEVSFQAAARFSRNVYRAIDPRIPADRRKAPDGMSNLTI
jgi:hypothetical protein